MAYLFGDGFDLYTTAGALGLGYWDVVASNWGVYPSQGRFGGGCIRIDNAGGNAVHLVKNSGANDSVHHINCAFLQVNPVTATTLAYYFQLLDGTTGQCCICFRSDGVILLTSGTPGGTVLATYSGAFPAANVWYSYEFEVIIHPTAGRFRVRKGGNPVDDYDSGAVLNTRPGTNTYANKLQIGQNAYYPQNLDDVLWRSDAASVPFIGDARCYTRLPTTDASAQFARSPNLVSSSYQSNTTNTRTVNTTNYLPFTAGYTGTVSSASVLVNVNTTAHVKMAIYDANRQIVLGTSSEITNPVLGANAVTFTPPVAVVRGATYHLAINQDASVPYNSTSGVSPGIYISTQTYASFPIASPTSLTGGQQGNSATFNITPTVNAEFVNEAQQDNTTSYVYDAVPGHADFYNHDPITAPMLSHVAVTTRGHIVKGDAGARTGTVQMKSSASTVAAPTLNLTTSFQWAWRTDALNPATGTAWTVATANAATAGPVVVT